MSPKAQFVNCEDCGKLIEDDPKGKPRRFCDATCRQRAHRGVKGRPRRYCSNCGQRLPKASRSNRRYCDSKCRLSHRTKKDQQARGTTNDDEA